MVQQFERNEKCNVCNSRVFEFNVSERVLFREMLEKLSGKFALKQPAVYDGTRLVFVAGAGDLAESVLYKLDKNLR